MNEIRGILTEAEIKSLTNFLGYDRTIGDFIRYIDSGQFNPINSTYLRQLRDKVARFSLQQRSAIEEYSKQILNDV